MHRFHKWTRWSEPKEEHGVFSFYTGVKIPYTELIQRRECSFCGKVEQRKVTTRHEN